MIEHACDHQHDPDGERRVGERVDRVDREEAVDDEPDQDGVRDGAGADAGTERPRERRARTSATTMFAVPNDSDVCSEMPWLSTSQGERPSSDSSRKHDPEREQEQADASDTERTTTEPRTRGGACTRSAYARAGHATERAQPAPAGLRLPALHARNGPHRGHPDVEKPGDQRERAREGCVSGRRIAVTPS